MYIAWILFLHLEITFEDSRDDPCMHHNHWSLLSVHVHVLVLLVVYVKITVRRPKKPVSTLVSRL